MLHLYNRATMAGALTLDLEPRLHALLADRIASLGDDLVDWTEFLVVQAGDEEADIVRHLRMSPLEDPATGVRYGQPSFEPPYEWLIDHQGYFELIVPVGPTYAYVIFVPDTEATFPALLAMCREQAAQRRE